MVTRCKKEEKLKNEHLGERHVLPQVVSIGRPVERRVALPVDLGSLPGTSSMDASRLEPRRDGP